MVELRIGGLTPQEHYRLHGCLPPETQEKLLDVLEDWTLLLNAAIDLVSDLRDWEYVLKDEFDTSYASAFLKVVEGQHVYA